MLLISKRTAGEERSRSVGSFFLRLKMGCHGRFLRCRSLLSLFVK